MAGNSLGRIAESEDWTRCLYIWSLGSYGLFNAIKVFCWCIYIKGHNEQALNIRNNTEQVLQSQITDLQSNIVVTGTNVQLYRAVH